MAILIAKIGSMWQLITEVKQVQALTLPWGDHLRKFTGYK